MTARNKLEQLQHVSTIVADTGDISAIRQYQPQDATTNPSLLLKASLLPLYQPLLQEAATFAAASTGTATEQKNLACDKFATLIGREILQVIKGYVSTEVDARLSFDKFATIIKARQLIQLYADLGIERSRILIKIAATWEGIQAARVLQQEGINCNLTLLFSLEQAMACADAGVFLISPFVGRITDWHKAHSGVTHYSANEDPGVQSVQRIFNHYKAFGYNTIIMGASFRNTAQIEALAGIDKLTISPALLAELQQDYSPLSQPLSLPAQQPNKPQALTESLMRWQLNNNAMATEKLAEGIRLFAEDQIKLEQNFTH